MTGTLNCMNTGTTRVTREQAAAHAGVHPRTINRWGAQGRIRVWRDPSFRRPAEYDLGEVMAAANRTAELGALLRNTS